MAGLAQSSTSEVIARELGSKAQIPNIGDQTPNAARVACAVVENYLADCLNSPARHREALNATKRIADLAQMSAGVFVWKHWQKLPLFVNWPIGSEKFGFELRRLTSAFEGRSSIDLVRESECQAERVRQVLGRLEVGTGSQSHDAPCRRFAGGRRAPLTGRNFLMWHRF
jgi:hypothetical protein